ncbi:MAG TPA: ABC transporter substrate-binding protein [Candidatus Angelobacter sp.]|nr:ABC transporter substrate-binding protein [Candidatus Angelobacter sp.]
MKRFVLFPLIVLITAGAMAQSGSELRFCVRSEPKSLHPLLAEEESSGAIVYLTGGVLLRVNRATQEIEPELATSWKLSQENRTIQFTLRSGAHFSDGTPFSAEDVAYTMQQLMDPNLHSPTGDAFRSGEGKVTTKVIAPLRVEIAFPAPVANLVRLFDTVPILSAHSPQKEMAALGPFYIAEHKAGTYILLKRNPYYWKKDAQGKQLPYLDAVRVEIQQSREIEALRYKRGEVHLINVVLPDIFESFGADNSSLVRDAGVSGDAEQLWFNQSPAKSIPAYKHAWFTSTSFRRAVSEAINRADMARIIYHGHAQPAIGPVFAGNKFWVNNKLKPHPYNPSEALRSLKGDGFRQENGQLLDKLGNPVEFSIITNAGNHARESMAAMVQQDLAKIGIKVNVVTLDFHSLIERISDTFDYEACLLGMLNADLDPNSQMNIWLSSEPNHQWYPSQKTPATPWEAEIDRLMRAQASATDDHQRKELWDRVQEIAWEQEPFIYLVNKDALVAVAPTVKNARPSPLYPQTYWNVEELALAPAGH